MPSPPAPPLHHDVPQRGKLGTGKTWNGNQIMPWFINGRRRRFSRCHFQLSWHAVCPTASRKWQQPIKGQITTTVHGLCLFLCHSPGMSGFHFRGGGGGGQ